MKKLLLALILLAFSTMAPAQSHLINCPTGDISGDCIVDMNDLTQLAANWLSGQNDLDVFGYIASDWHNIGPSVIVINEIHYKPEVKTLALEYIELHNTASVAIDISDWSFDKGVDYTFPANVYIPAGGYIVIAQDKATLAGFYALDASVVYGPYSGKLSNDGETLRLVDNLGDTVDIVDYSVGFPWPTMALGEGSSLELVNPLVDNDLAGNWRSSGYSTGIYSGSPTPAEVNSALMSNNAPCIRQVVHEPSAPA
ncbi:MAG: lamin tail domain-containing protein, partial [Sedimentisphaerales bacterium]|nr:lamin tail domain-containing protein [Sedimentisphaerales bacterium]